MASCDWMMLLLVRFAVESVESSDDAQQAMVSKWLGAEPEVLWSDCRPVR